MALLEVDGIVAATSQGSISSTASGCALSRGRSPALSGRMALESQRCSRRSSGSCIPDRGALSLTGVRFSVSPHTIKRLGISYAPQGTNIFPHLTVQENLQLGAWVLRRQGTRVAGFVERALYGFPPRLRESAAGVLRP